MRAALWGPACLAAASWLVAGCGGGPSTAPKVAATSPPTGEIVVTRTAAGGGTALHVLAADGTADHPLATNAADAASDADGAALAFVRDGAIWIMRRDGSTQRRLTHPAPAGAGARGASPAPGDDALSDGSPAWAPDRRAIYFSRMRWRETMSSLYSVDVARGRVRPLTAPVGAFLGTGGYGACQQDPAPTRAIVSYAVVSDCVHGTEAYIDAVALDGGRAEVPVRFPQSDGGVEYLIGHPAWSPDGTRLLYDLQDWDAWTSGAGAGASGIYVSPVGGRPRRIAAPIGGGAYVSSPTWSPDGRWLAFANLTFVGEDWVSSVWVVRIDGGRLTRLSGQGANDGDPVWLAPARGE